MTYSSFTGSGSPVSRNDESFHGGLYVIPFSTTRWRVLGTLLYSCVFPLSHNGNMLIVFLLLVCSGLLIFNVRLSDVMDFVCTQTAEILLKS